MNALRVLLAAAVCFACTVFAPAAPPAGKLNVLFLPVDDLRPELNCYGATHVKSPNLDRLAAAGVLFQRAYCQQAVCSPSRTSLLTGLRPDSTRVYDLETHFRDTVPDVITLPQHFKNQGYHTQSMGKVFHLGLDDKRSWTVPTVERPGGKLHNLPENIELMKTAQEEAAKRGLKGKALAHAGRAAPYECADVPDNAYPDGALADKAVETLDQVAKQDQPFFLAVGFFRPHLPFNSPKKYWDLYSEQEIRLAPNPFAPQDMPVLAGTDFGELRAYFGVPKQGPVDDELARKLKHGYFAAVSYMDAQVGRVINELERLGLRDRTIIVLWGDHGWKLGEHGMWCKHTNFELDARSSLLVSVPGAKANGESSRALVEFVDIYPTLCELAGLPLPAHLEGTSFAPVFRDPSWHGKPAAFSQYPRRTAMGYSMRTDRYRFTQWVEAKEHSKLLAVELYDHEKDPDENVNVAPDPAHAEVVKQLTAQAAKGWQGAKP